MVERLMLFLIALAIVVLVAFGLPILNLKLRFADQSSLMKIMGIGFSVLMGLLIIYRVVFVTPVAPKPRYHVGPIPVKVCDGFDMVELDRLRIETAPRCELDFFVSSAPCVCTGAGETTIPQGWVEFVRSPSSEDGEFQYEVFPVEGRWLSADGEDLPVGPLRGGCARSSEHEDKKKHEIVHICGYEHVLGDPTTGDIRGHVMSRTRETIGDDTRGLDLGHEELYTPTVE